MIKKLITLGLGLILLMAFSVYGTSTVTDTGALGAFFTTSGAHVPTIQSWNGTALTSQSAPSFAGEPEWIITKASPARNQHMVGAIGQGASGFVGVAVWNGTSWIDNRTLSSLIGTTNDQYRGIDIAYLSNGHALVVYNNNSVNASYGIWNGTTWSAFGTMAADNCTDTVLWVELIAGANGTAYDIEMDDNGDFCGHFWDGTSWTNTRTLQTATTSKSSKRFGIAVEALTGDALAVWEGPTAGVMQACAYDFDNSTGWCNSIMSLNDVGSANSWIQLASHPTSNRIMVATYEQSADDVNAIEWNGAAFGNANTPVTIDSSSEASADGVVDVSYTGDKAMLVYDDSNADNPTYAWCENTTGCANGNWTVLGTTGLTNCGESSDIDFIGLDDDPFSNSTLLFMTSQSTHYKCVQEWTGTMWDAGFNSIGSGIALSDAFDFSVAYDQFRDIVAPVFSVASNLTQETTSSAGNNITYTSPTATDAIDGTRQVTCAPASGTTFALGTTTVNCNATDLSSNLATTSFTITVTDTTAPNLTITSPMATAYTTKTILINASAADAVALATIEYRYNDSLGNSSAWSDLGSPVLRDFSDNSTVTLAVRATDSSNNSVTTDVVFGVNVSAAPDITAPVISDVTLASTNATITINWTTNEAANTTVDYGLTADVLDTRVESSSLVTIHSIELSGLVNNTSYSLNETSCDPSGNCVTTGTYSITTEQNEDTTAPIIASVATSAITNESFTIAWMTDELSDTRVMYGIATLNTSADDSALTLEHELTLSGLDNNTQVLFTLTSCDAVDNCASSSGFNVTTEQNAPPAEAPMVAEASTSRRSSKSKSVPVETVAEPSLPITTTKIATPELPITEAVIESPTLPTLELAPEVNSSILSSITAFAFSDIAKQTTTRYFLIALVIVIGAATMLLVMFRKKKEPLPEGTNILSDRTDEPLLPYSMLIDAQKVLSHALKGTAQTWKGLFGHYSPFVVHTCQEALKEVRKHPVEGDLPKAEFDYIGASTFARLVRVIATMQLNGLKTGVVGKHHHEIFAEVRPAETQELAVLRSVKLKVPKDVEKALALIRHGKGIVLINVEALKDDTASLKTVLKHLKRTAEANNGHIIGVGNHGVIATHSIPIVTNHGGE